MCVRAVVMCYANVVVCGFVCVRTVVRVADNCGVSVVICMDGVCSTPFSPIASPVTQSVFVATPFRMHCFLVSSASVSLMFFAVCVARGVAARSASIEFRGSIPPMDTSVGCRFVSGSSI